MSQGGLQVKVKPKLLWLTAEAHDVFQAEGFVVTMACAGAEGLGFLQDEDYDVILVNFPLPDWSGDEALMEALQRVGGETPIVAYSPLATQSGLARLAHLGAFHAMSSGEATSVLRLAASHHWEREAHRNRRESRDVWRDMLIGESRQVQQVVGLIRLTAPRRCTVLISGETGTGKEVVARALHAASNRAGVPMVAVNCSALPETLLEAELFGHVRGAFTGAHQNRVGRFEQAHRGTLFLDEIGDLPLPLQAKLLRVLQEREFQRLGSSENVRVDVRVIAASNADLAVRVREGKFREDLYYRLNVVPVAIPPLRERSADIPLLANHFVERVCAAEGIPPKQIARETLHRLAAHDWPGNVRQLENAVEKAVVLSGDRRLLCPADFPLPPRTLPAAGGVHPVIAVPDYGLDFEQTVGTLERDILEQALRKTKGNKKLAAEMLGLKRTTLAAKLKSLSAVAAVG